MNWEEKYKEIGHWLSRQGYEFEFDKDGFWFEEYITEHKWKDVFEMMHKYVEGQWVDGFMAGRHDAIKKLENN